MGRNLYDSHGNYKGYLSDGGLIFDKNGFLESTLEELPSGTEIRNHSGRVIGRKSFYANEIEYKGKDY